MTSDSPGGIHTAAAAQSGVTNTHGKRKAPATMNDHSRVYCSARNDASGNAHPHVGSWSNAWVIVSVTAARSSAPAVRTSS